MRKIEVPNPITYFAANPYSECLVLSISVSDADKVVEVVCTYFDLKRLLDYKSRADQSSGMEEGIREFHRISFCGISGVKRKNTTFRHGFRNFDILSLNFGPGTQLSTVINYIAIKQDIDILSATVSCFELGDYTFLFTSVSVDAINGRAVNVGPQQWEYYDIETGRYIDFTQPFGPGSLQGG